MHPVCMRTRPGRILGQVPNFIDQLTGWSLVIFKEFPSYSPFDSTGPVPIEPNSCGNAAMRDRVPEPIKQHSYDVFSVVWLRQIPACPSDNVFPPALI